MAHGNVRPFRVAVSDQELQNLKDRLANTRFPDQLQNIAPWEDGTDLPYFQEFVAHWRSGYDWRRWEAVLNAMPQFTTTVRGIELHFVHERSPSADAVPLLLLHGWPGSFFEFYKLVPLLRASGRFHIVAPSLPGYGFSSAPQQRGCGATAIADCVDSLMASLGYGRYIAQGGDWGAIVCRALAKYHQGSCAAVHLNMCVARPAPWNPLHWLQGANAMLLPRTPLLLNRAEIRGVRDMVRFQKQETAYQRVQGTKPQTLAYALTDSPAGLAAWILEKFRTWSDCGGQPESLGPLFRDEVITNVCIYWFGGRIASSLRLYKETLANKAELSELMGGFTPTPTAVALFPHELHRPPRAWARAAYNVQRWTVMPAGGHFAALEQPQLLAQDVLAFADLARSKGWV